MKLRLKQRLVSRVFDVFDSKGNTMYVAEGELAWGHFLHFYDADGNDVACIRGENGIARRSFEMYMDGNYVGNLCWRFSWFTSEFDLDYNGWKMVCDASERRYTISTATGEEVVATATQKVWNLMATYEIDIRNPRDVLPVLMVILSAIVEKSLRL